MHLVIVPTPIGNLRDITFRAVDALKECDFILAEDTRQTKKLLHHLSIEKELISYRQDNEHAVVPGLIKRISSSNKVALVTDAGTPGISDPGFLLVRECIKNQIVIECLPGPTAFVPALVISGLPCEKFVFEGFLPHKKGRETRIRQIAEETKTVILYESPHRLLKTLQQLLQFCGNRQCSVSRELSKLHEETIRGNLYTVLGHFQENEPRGEFVIILAGKEE